MEPSERVELLERAEELNRSRNWEGMIELLEPLPQTVYKQQPELVFFLALAKRHLGNPNAAKALLDLIRENSVRRQQDRLYRLSRNLEGMIAVDFGDLEVAEECFTDSQLAAMRVGDIHMTGLTTMHLGIVADIRCEWQVAVAYYQRCLSLWKSEGKPLFLGMTHHNLAMALREIQLLRDADEHFERALKIYPKSGADEVIASAHLERALVQSLRGDHALAERNVRRALDRAQRTRFVGVEAQALRVLGIVLARKGELAEAESSLRASRQIAKRMGGKMLLAEIQEGLAFIAHERGLPKTADRRSGIAAVLYRRMGATGRAERALAALSPALELSVA